MGESIQEALAITLALGCVVIALVFTIAPVLPGGIFVPLGALLYGLFAGFDDFGWVFWVGQVLLVVAGLAVDNVAQIFGVKRVGGTKQGMIGGAIGMFLGPFALAFLGPFALFIGPFVGAVVGTVAGEMYVHRDHRAAGKVGGVAAVTYLVGILARLVLVGVQVVWLVLAIF